MNINHGLLEAFGVGTRELDELVYAARGAGGALEPSSPEQEAEAA